MAKLLSNDTAAKVLRLISSKEMTQSSGVPRDLGAADADPLLFALRVVTRSEAKEVQVYCPDGMPLMYDRYLNYFADSTLTPDIKNADWLSLSGTVTLGTSIYAVFDTEESCVKFSSTEPTEVDGDMPPYIVIGETAETAPSSGKYTVSQYWLGHYAMQYMQDIVAPFSIKSVDGEILMYFPADSLRVNGLDMSGATTGLSLSSEADWYVVTSYTTGLNLYVLMDYTDGYYGKPATSEFGTEAPSSNGEVITIPVLACPDEKIINVQLGAINIDAVRPDGNNTASNCKSLVRSTTDSEFGGNDQTVGLHGFRSATAPQEDPFDTSLTLFSHHFALRESNGTDTDLRWITAAKLAEGVADYISDPENETPVTVEPDLDGTFWEWYDSLTDEEKRFWEKGAGCSVNYGESIGDSNQDEVINLDEKSLKGSWFVEQDLQAKVVNCKELNISEENGTPGYAGNLTVAGTFQYQGKNIHLSNDGLVYWST